LIERLLYREGACGWGQTPQSKSCGQEGRYGVLHSKFIMTLVKVLASTWFVCLFVCLFEYNPKSKTAGITCTRGAWLFKTVLPSALKPP